MKIQNEKEIVDVIVDYLADQIEKEMRKRDMIYKIRCKSCNVILETVVPLRGEIKCKCGNVGIYSDYIKYGMIKNLPADECFEDLSKKLTIKEVEEIEDFFEKHN